MRRIFDSAEPAHGEPVTLREAYDVPRPRPAGRPWIGLLMVASVDGTTVVDHRSGGLSNEADKQLLGTLRSIADLVIVGAGTVRAEGYGPPKQPGQRIAVASNSGKVDTTTPLFTSGAGFLLLPEDAPAQSVDTVRAGVGTLDLAAAIAQLDVAFAQVEGGPGLNGSLLDADLVDELNLTISPQLAGGDGPRVTHGAAAASQRMRLAHVLEDDGFLFTRYVRA